MSTLSGQPIAQRPDELRKFIKTLQKEKVKSYLEIGARYGDTFFEVVRHLPPGSKAVAVDMVDGYWGRSDSREYLENAVAELVKLGYEASAIFGDSTSLATRQLVAGRSTEYDCILIDGDHRYEGLTIDWVNYKPHAKKLVAFHDIDGQEHYERRSGAPVEVPYVWNILKRHYPYQEIIGKKRGMGIGVLWM